MTIQSPAQRTISGNPDDAKAINPSLPLYVRGMLILVALIQMIGATMFVAPDLVGPRWPWQITPFPFNERFLGAIYVSELITILTLLVINRWTPARVIMLMAIIFTAVVTIVSFFYLDKFDFSHIAPWAWFVVYIVPPLVMGYYYPRQRLLPPSPAVSTSSGWRIYLYAEGTIMALYGVLLLILPATFGAFWPWKVDDFHLRVYSAIFISAICTFLLTRRAAPVEFCILGLSQVALGLSSILSVVWVDSTVHKVNWSNSAIYIWFIGFALFALAGIAMMMQAQRMGAVSR